MKVALMFSGQGAQKVGMGKDLIQSSESARRRFEEADALLGWPLSQFCFEGPEEALTETKVCQPALYVHGMAVHGILEERGRLGGAVVAMGLSLGEVTACAAAGVFDFSTGLRIVAERGRLMQEACKQSDGSMAAVIGVDRETVEAFSAEMGVQMANLNCPGQIVVSGERAKIDAAVEEGRRRGFRRVLPLNVAGAYHSRLMEPSRERFADFLNGIEFNAPRINLISNTTGGLLSEPEAIRAALARQLVSPVLWEDCLRAASSLGAEAFWELGVGGTLCGHVKRTCREWPSSSFETWKDLELAP